MRILQKLLLGNKVAGAVKAFPGYLLKSLMAGSPWEKALSKEGMININQLLSLLGKTSKLELSVIGSVLSNLFEGQKLIDYNALKEAVHNDLITYSRKPLTRYSTYGMNRLGFDVRRESDGAGGILEYLPGIKVNTFTFESPKISVGNAKHYDPTTLGHSRTYTTSEEPEVLHVMESLSDWGQHPVRNHIIIDKKYFPTKEEIKAHEDRLFFRIFANQVDPEYTEEWQKLKHYALKIGPDNLYTVADKFSPEFVEYVDKKFEVPYTSWAAQLRLASLRFNKSEGSNIRLLSYLHDNYLQRLLQENLKYAAEHGLSKMRYPTPETVAKIEGYPKTERTPEYLNAIEELDRLSVRDGELAPVPDEINLFNDEATYYTPERRAQLLREAENRVVELLRAQKAFTYSPQHQTILKKYAGFPKLFNSLYKAQNVRTVTDAKGNTWYEVDVPNDYLKSEWLFKLGGQIKKRF